MNSRALTLVEMLVVIGVVVLLVGILLPVLASGRRSSQVSACASNVRQVATAMLARAGERDAHLPLAGVIDVGSPAAGDVPDWVNDPARRRYDYVRAGQTSASTWWPAPVPVALAPHLGGEAADGVADLLAWMRTNRQVSDTFRCPSEAARDTIRSTVLVRRGGITNNLNWPVETHYAFNGNVLGYDAQSDRPLRGRLTRLRDASRVVLLADADTSTGVGVAAWQLRRGDGGRSDLADAAADAARFEAVVTPGPQARHGGVLNVGYADGHVTGGRDATLALLTPDASP